MGEELPLGLFEEWLPEHRTPARGQSRLACQAGRWRAQTPLQAVLRRGRAGRHVPASERQATLPPSHISRKSPRDCPGPTRRRKLLLDLPSQWVAGLSCDAAALPADPSQGNTVISVSLVRPARRSSPHLGNHPRDAAAVQFPAMKSTTGSKRLPSESGLFVSQIPRLS